MNERIRTSLTGKQPVNPWNEDEIRQQASRAWHANGIIMVKPNWIKDDFDKQQAINIANKTHGKRKGE